MLDTGPRRLIKDTVLISLDERPGRLMEDTVLISLEEGPLRMVEDTILRSLDAGSRWRALLFSVWTWCVIVRCQWDGVGRGHRTLDTLFCPGRVTQDGATNIRQKTEQSTHGSMLNGRRIAE